MQESYSLEEQRSYAVVAMLSGMFLWTGAGILHQLYPEQELLIVGVSVLGGVDALLGLLLFTLIHMTDTPPNRKVDENTPTE